MSNQPEPRSVGETGPPRGVPGRPPGGAGSPPGCWSCWCRPRTRSAAGPSGCSLIKMVLRKGFPYQYYPTELFKLSQLDERASIVYQSQSSTFQLSYLPGIERKQNMFFTLVLQL